MRISIQAANSATINRIYVLHSSRKYQSLLIILQKYMFNCNFPTMTESNYNEVELNDTFLHACIQPMLMPNMTIFAVKNVYVNVYQNTITYFLNRKVALGILMVNSKFQVQISDSFRGASYGAAYLPTPSYHFRFSLKSHIRINFIFCTSNQISVFTSKHGILITYRQTLLLLLLCTWRKLQV